MHAIGGGFIWPCSSVRDSWGGEGLCNVLCRDLESRRGVGVWEEQCHCKAGFLHHQVMQGTQGPEEDLRGAGCTKSLG